MRQRTWLRIAAAAGALTLVAAACGDDDDEAGDTTETTEEDGGAAPTGDQLVFGRVLPETGPLGFLGPPMIVGTELAVEDINEAGGVLGQDVELLEGDEGETPQIARETVTRLLGEGANAIIGAAASGSSQAVIARADDYGNALGQLAVDRLTEGGATVSPANLISYDPEAATFDAEVAQISGASPDAVVLISFAEGGQIVAGLLEAGITPEQIYGGDGVFGPFSEEVDPGDPTAATYAIGQFEDGGVLTILESVETDLAQ